MAGAYVQSGNAVGASGATLETVTLGSNVQLGNWLLVVTYVYHTGTVTPSVTDNLGNVYTQVQGDDTTLTFYNGGETLPTSIWLAPVTVAGACTITASYGVAGYPWLVVTEISGLAASSPVEHAVIVNRQVNPGTAADAVTSGSVTTTADGQFIFGYSFTAIGGDTPASGTGYTQRLHDTATQADTEDKTQATHGAVAATFTIPTGGVGNVYYSGIITLKVAGGSTFSRTASDTGLTISSSLTRRAGRFKSDTGLTTTDTLARGPARTITDTGLTVSESVGSRRLALSDTGLSVSDSIRLPRRPRLADTGLSLADGLTIGTVRPDPVLRPLGTFSNTLGCGLYDVYIMERGGNKLAVGNVPWDSLTWTRTFEETSSASFTDASGDCLGLLAAVRAWKHELAVYRDGALIWVGPVFAPNSNTTEQATTYQLDARDLSAWFDRRFVHNDMAFDGVDYATIFEAIVADALAPDPSPNLSLAASPTLKYGGFQASASQHLMAGDQLRSLSQNGVDWYVVKREMIVGGIAAPTSILGVMVDEHFITSPQINLSGEVQANRWIARGNGSGAEGDSIFGDASDNGSKAVYGLLERVDTDLSIIDQPTADSAAQSRKNALSEIIQVESAILTQHAPYTIDDLVPGRVVDLRLRYTAPPVSGLFRIKSISAQVNAQEGTDYITLTFQPLEPTESHATFRGMGTSADRLRDTLRRTEQRLAALESSQRLTGEVSLAEAFSLGGLAVTVREVVGGGGVISLVFTNTSTGKTYSITV